MVVRLCVCLQKELGRQLSTRPRRVSHWPLPCEKVSETWVGAPTNSLMSAQQARTNERTNQGGQAFGVHHGCIGVFLCQKPAGKRVMPALAREDQSSGVSTCPGVGIEVTAFEQKAVDARTRAEGARQLTWGCGVWGVGCD